VIGGPRVRNQSDPTQTHKPPADEKRPANAGLLEAADGIRTHDLLHGKQFGDWLHALNVPANVLLLPRQGMPPMPRIHREIPGVFGLKPD
jgi:hypothetical protein